MRFPRRTIGDQRLIELVPVMNVVLLLLVFFLINWSFVLQPGMPVHLPSTGITTVSPQGRHVITLKSRGAALRDEVDYYFDTQNVDEGGLESCLKREASATSPGEWITLNADQSVGHGHVVRVASLAMKHGFHVTLATQQTVPAAGEQKL